MIGGVDWHLPNRKVTFLRSAFFLVDAAIFSFLSRSSHDLIALRILSTLYPVGAKKSELQVRMILYQKLFVVCFASTNTHASPSLRDNHEIPNKVMFKKVAITPESKDRLFMNYTALGCCSGNILHSDP